MATNDNNPKLHDLQIPEFSLENEEDPAINPSKNPNI
jgi:hypothetical protein